jgi:hypothetical protein
VVAQGSRRESAMQGPGTCHPVSGYNRLERSDCQDKSHDQLLRWEGPAQGLSRGSVP